MIGAATKAAIEAAIREVTTARAKAWRAADEANYAAVRANAAADEAKEASGAADRAATILSGILDAAKLAEGS